MDPDPEAVAHLVRRAYGVDARLLLALLRWGGHPVFDFWAAAEEGRLVGTTLVTYSGRAGTLSSVAVAAPWRRRGWARALLDRAHRGIRAARRRYALLEVLRENAPARALYLSSGYRPFRAYEVLARPGTDVVPPVAPSAGVRPFRPADGPALAELLSAQSPEELHRAAPGDPGQFRVPSYLLGATGAATEAWVLGSSAGASGFVRATVGGLTRTANLTQPILAEGTGPEEASALLATALGWISLRTRARTVVQVPTDLPRAVRAVTALGFRPQYAVDLFGREILP
ncbi:MAG: GNAT family N-acetyltransferase [Thermoplasmata archaeon]